MKKLPISAYIITKNAENTIEMVLKSLDFCDEIVVVDSGSTDSTEKICKKYNVVWYYQEFLGFGKQKRFASSKTKNNWVLNVDADEVVTTELKYSILKKFEKMIVPHYSGVYIAIDNIFMGKIIKFWKGHTYGHVRLYDKTKCEFDEAPVHEIVKTTGLIFETQYSIHHFSYRNLENYFEKFNKYTTLGAQKEISKNKKLSKFQIALRPFITFINLYFVRGGLMNGWPGFVWCMCSGFYPFVKYAKVIEQLEHKNTKI